MKNEQGIRARAHDSVATLPVRNGDLAKTLNTLRTVPGAPNPFVHSSLNNDQPLGQSTNNAPVSSNSPSK